MCCSYLNSYSSVQYNNVSHVRNTCCFLSFSASASVLYLFFQLRSILRLSSASLHSFWSACESASSEVTLSTDCWGPSASRYPLNCLWEEEDSLLTFFSLSCCFEISAASHFCFLHSLFCRRAAFFSRS